MNFLGNKDNYRFRRNRRPVEVVPSRLNKIKDRTLSSFNVGISYFVAVTSPYAMKSFWSLIFNVIWKFFLIQYFEKMGIVRIPVKNVGNCLDRKIPFKPEKLCVYLDFINHWVRFLALLVGLFGYRKGSMFVGEFLDYMSYTYSKAYEFYRSQMTTTERPSCGEKAIQRLQFWDPHYLCVPSLHISVMCITYGYALMLKNRENIHLEEYDRWMKEMYDHGVEIAESVMYMKQHSVNCIPSAIYMVSRTSPELLTADIAVLFIDSLFRNSEDILPEDKKAIVAHINFLYERLLLEGAGEDDWKTPVKRWLESYGAD